MPEARRAGVLLQAALLVLTLFTAPALHRKHCNGVCAGDRREAAREEPRHTCCGGAEQGPASKSDDGCQCLDDCCSIVGCCVTPDVVSDTGPGTLVITKARAWSPDEAPRAPEARLLPYPTGPPPIA